MSILKQQISLALVFILHSWTFFLPAVCQMFEKLNQVYIALYSSCETFLQIFSFPPHLQTLVRFQLAETLLPDLC